MAAHALALESAATSATPRGREVVLETMFGDYREAAGVAFAGSVEAGVAGRPRRPRIMVETVDVNPALDDTRFQIPR